MVEAGWLLEILHSTVAEQVIDWMRCETEGLETEMAVGDAESLFSSNGEDCLLMCSPYLDI